MSPSADTAHIGQRLPATSNGEGKRRFREFDLAGKVFVVTGGARGLGLAMAEAVVEAGGTGKAIGHFFGH